MAVVISDEVLDRGDRLLEAEPDEHLVMLARRGHDAAFAAIVRRYEPELLAQARRLSVDGGGEDAVQQTFLNAFAALQAGGEVRHLRGWLHQILRHAVIRSRVPVDAPLEAASAFGESLEETVQRRAQAHAMLAELSALPERQRDALLGTAVMGFPRAQVAQRMGLSEGAVRQLVHRARLRLRQAVTALVPFPLGRLFGGGGATGSETVLGAGAAASGGAAIKVGTLLASGVVATGLAVTQSLPSRHHRGGLAPVTRHLTTSARRAPRLIEAPATRGGAATAAAATRLVAHAPTPAHVGSRLSGSGVLNGSGDSHQGSGPARARDGARAQRSGRRGAQGSGTAGHGQEEGAHRPVSGRDGGSSGDDHGGGSGAGSASGSGAGAGGGPSSGTPGSTSSTGDRGSPGGDSRTGRDGSGSGSGEATSTGGSSDGSGSSGGQDNPSGSRDLSGSAGSSSS